MANYNSDNFKLGPCVVSFGGTALGGTKGGVKVTMEADTYEVKCDQNYATPVKKIITGLKFNVSMSLLEIDTAFAQLLDSNGQIASSLLGSDLLANGKALLLTPVDSSDAYALNFPNAILEPGFEYSYDVENSQVLALKFTAHADDNDIFFEQVAVSAG